MKKRINFFKLQAPFLIMSTVLVGISLWSIFFGNKFEMSTDFTGGIEIMVTFDQDTTSQQIDEIFNAKDIEVEIQPILTIKNAFFVRAVASGDQNTVEYVEELKSIIAEDLVDNEPSFEKSSLVGAIMSKDNQRQALKIIIIAIIAEIFYLTIRFKFYYALAAITALIHDVLIMAGAISLFGRQVDVLTISAVLTILGYSVNDTIILFDRVRENIHLKVSPDIKSLLNISINQIIARTLFTSLTTFFVIIMLNIFSTGSLENFSYALIIGVISGTYSSIYIAATFIIIWDKYKRVI